jgi:hypothetical protein
MQLEMALHQLHAEMKADELLFWGKITGKYHNQSKKHNAPIIISSFEEEISNNYIYIGINKDYYIALAITYEG